MRPTWRRLRPQPRRATRTLAATEPRRTPPSPSDTLAGSGLASRLVPESEWDSVRAFLSHGRGDVAVRHRAAGTAPRTSGTHVPDRVRQAHEREHPTARADTSMPAVAAQPSNRSGTAIVREGWRP